jgi:hypothetical protein
VILGFGAIGSGVLPLLFRHIDMKADQLIVVSDQYSQKQRDHAATYGVKLHTAKLTKTDYKPALQKYIGKGDFLVNLSVDVSSCALIEYCQEVDALYMDTCNEPWAGGYSDPNVSAAERTNYAFREEALEFRKKFQKDGPTALITHGANPGLVSHFVKQGLLNIAKDTNTPFTMPKTREQWVDLAQKLDIKTIHISERDTQASASVIKHDQVSRRTCTSGKPATAIRRLSSALANVHANIRLLNRSRKLEQKPVANFASVRRSSSIPGRSRDTSRRVSSRPSSDGDRTRSTGRMMERRTITDGQSPHSATSSHALAIRLPSLSFVC